MKRLGAVLAAAAVATLGTFAVASPASAEEAPPTYASGEWLLQDWTGLYPDTVPSEASESTADCTTVVLTKPNTEGDVVYPPTANGDVGTSYENGDLDLAVEAGDKLVVDYTMSNAANGAAGAVRMFAYDSIDADTLMDGPTFDPAIAPETADGTLEITFAADDIVGTFGLTYDASNDTEGSVTFTNLRLITGEEEEQPIAFCAAPAPETTEPTTATSTATVTAATLPVTGPGTTGVIVAGAVLVVGGTLLVILMRKRRDQEQVQQ